MRLGSFSLPLHPCLCYDLSVPVGASPVQLRNTEAEGRHDKDPADLGGVFVLRFIFDVLSIKLLLAIFDLGIRHHAPEGGVAIANAPEDHPDLDRLFAHDGRQAPVLHLLHTHRAVHSRFLPHRQHGGPILLDRS